MGKVLIIKKEQEKEQDKDKQDQNQQDQQNQDQQQQPPQQQENQMSKENGKFTPEMLDIYGSYADGYDK